MNLRCYDCAQDPRTLGLLLSSICLADAAARIDIKTKSLYTLSNGQRGNVDLSRETCLRSAVDNPRSGTLLLDVSVIHGIASLRYTSERRFIYYDENGRLHGVSNALLCFCRSCCVDAAMVQSKNSTIR